MSTDRIEAAARALDEMGEVRAIHVARMIATDLLTAADKADAANGIVRVRLDDPSTVERIAQAVTRADYGGYTYVTEADRAIARRVLAALKGDTP